MSRVGWVDCGSGASGDMLLGALVAAGVPLAVLQGAVDAVAPERLRLVAEPVTRNGIAAQHVRVEGTESHHHRTWADVRALLDGADLDGADLDRADLGRVGLGDAVRTAARTAFERLAEAEARVHGTTPDRIYFHEVGALDAIADVVGACAGFAYLGLDELHAGPVAVGSGFVTAAHGRLPVPVPAVVELFAAGGVPSYGEPAGGTAGEPSGELCTPTGAALLVTHVDTWGPQPAMRVTAQAFGAGTRDPAGRANALRLLVGDRLAGDGTTSTQVVLETNVDDLDPRLWPGILQALLDAGAADAWLTPILMKKGRPAHMLAVLAEPGAEEAVRRVLFAETSALGLRRRTVTKEALGREQRTVRVGDDEVSVKVALQDGRVVNVQPEYDDVAAVAARTGQPVKAVLARAHAAAVTAFGVPVR